MCLSRQHPCISYVTRIWFVAVVISISLCAGCVLPPEKRTQVIDQGVSALERGVHAFNSHDYVLAASMFDRSLAFYRSLDDTNGIILSHINLSEVSTAIGNYGAAKKHLLSAKYVSHRDHVTSHLEQIELALVSIAIKQQKYEEATKILNTLLPEFDDEFQPTDLLNEVQLSALANRVHIAFDKDSPDKGVWTMKFKHALTFAREGSGSLTGRLRRFQAQLAIEENAFDQADAHYREALHHYKQDVHRSGIAATLEEWAKMLDSLGAWEDAEDRLRRAMFIRMWMLDRSGTERILLMLRQVNTKLGNTERAQTLQRWVQVLQDVAFNNSGLLRKEVVPY